MLEYSGLMKRKVFEDPATIMKSKIAGDIGEIRYVANLRHTDSSVAARSVGYRKNDNDKLVDKCSARSMTISWHQPSAASFMKVQKPKGSEHIVPGKCSILVAHALWSPS